MGALEAGWGAVDDDESVRAVQAAFAAGVTFFDTAANYGAGHSERVLGRALVQPPADAESDSGQPLAPGMLASHYAPRAKVRLNAVTLEAGEALLAFGLGAISGIDAASAVMNLSERGDLGEAAANLFGHLRALDGKGVHAIAVMPVPDEGLGEAINDRLRRAAVGRE